MFYALEKIVFNIRIMFLVDQIFNILECFERSCDTEHIGVMPAANLALQSQE